MTTQHCALPLGRGGRPILSLSRLGKRDASDTLERPTGEPEKPAETALPRVLTDAEHGAAMADLATVLGCSAEALPPVFKGLSPRPLMRGAKEALQDVFPAGDAERIGAWLGVWTRSAPYLHRLACGGQRHRLDGTPIETVTLADRKHSHRSLRQLALKK